MKHKCQHPAPARRFIGFGELLWCRICGAYCKFNERTSRWGRWYRPLQTTLPEVANRKE
jgi:hypothetical protein